MKLKRNLFNQFFVISVSAFMLTNTALAETILPSGLEIAQQVNARNEGASVSRNLIMEMVDRRGKKRVRETRGFRKYYGEEKRTMIFYLQPKNVRKTAFLTYDYPQADDDQWLYLPAMRKVRRISSSDRGDYFLGTDFTYEDIKKESKVGIEDYHWKTVGEEAIDGHHSYVVEAMPINDDVAQELGYSKVIYHVDSDIWMVRQSDHWDVRDNALKTINFRDIRLVQDIWSAHTLEVNNHKTGHHTRFLFSDIDYSTEVTDDIFTRQSLRRGL